MRFLEAFRQGLSELGWVEGKNINIEYRFAEGKDERLPDLAAELLRLKVASVEYSETTGLGNLVLARAPRVGPPPSQSGIVTC